MNKMSRQSELVPQIESTNLLLKNNITNKLKPWCRITGILYTIIIFCGIYAEVGVRGRFINFASAEETATNIESHAFQFRSTVLFELIMCCSDIGVAILLGAILYHVGADTVWIGLMCVFRLVQTSIIASNLLHAFAASLILDPSLADVTSAGVGLQRFLQGGEDGDQENGLLLADNLALLFLSIQKYGYTLALVFFGVSLFFLGMIMIGRDVVLFPQMLGWACIFAGVGYVLDAVMYFSWNGYNGQVSNFFMLPVFIAEFWLAGWFLFVKEPNNTRV